MSINKIKINNLILSGGISLFLIITSISIAYYFFVYLPKRDTSLVSIEKQKLELQQKQLDFQKNKLLFDRQATIIPTEKPENSSTKMTTQNVDCEKIAREKAREVLAKLILMQPDNQEYKKAYDAGLGRASDIDRYFDQCMQTNGMSNNINIRLK